MGLAHIFTAQIAVGACQIGRSEALFLSSHNTFKQSSLKGKDPVGDQQNPSALLLAFKFFFLY